MFRPLRTSLRVLAALAAFALVVLLILIGRLTFAPFSSTLLTPYIESRIEGWVPGTTVHIDHSVLAWNNIAHSVNLRAEKIEIESAEGKKIADIPFIDVKVNAIAALFGQLMPTALVVRQPHLIIERQSDYSFSFGGLSTSAPAPEQDGDQRENVARIVRQLTHAHFTRDLQVIDAVFDVHDRARGHDWSVHIPEITLMRSGMALNGKANIEVTEAAQPQKVELLYAYDRKSDRHRIITRMENITPSFFAGSPDTAAPSPLQALNLPLTGDIAFAFDDDLHLASAAADLHGGAGTLVEKDLWDKPRPVNALSAKAAYDRASGTLTVPNIALDLGGPTLDVSLEGTTPVGKRPMKIALTIKLANWPMDDFRDLWPKPLVPGARDWLADNISKGRYGHGEVVLKGDLDLNHPSDVDFTEGSGKVDAIDGTVRYVKTLPPVTGVNADASFDLNQMAITINAGNVGDLKIKPFTATITGFQDHVQNIDIPLKAKGPIPAVMKLIDMPPLGYARALGLTPGDVTGDADVQVTFRFPLFKDLAMSDIGIKAAAQLSSIASSKLIRGFDVSDGNLAMDLDMDGFTIKGPASLNKMPLNLDYFENFKNNNGKPLRTAHITANLTTEYWRDLGVHAFDGTSGAMPATLDMEQRTKDETKVTGVLDMTSAAVRVQKLGWSKAPGAPAIAHVSVTIPDKKDIQITKILIEGSNIDVQGKATLAEKRGTLLALSLAPIRVGRTDANLTVETPAGDQGNLKLTAEGKALDISGLADEDPKDKKDPSKQTNGQSNPDTSQEFHLDLGTFYTSLNGRLDNAKGYALRDRLGWSEISLQGDLEKQKHLDIELKPKPDGTRVFDVTCDDFGAALASFGVTDTVRNGPLNVHGESDIASPRTIQGDAHIGSFTVGDLPVLAVLMNAASPFGFAGLFTKSMDFSRLDGEFIWNGDQIDFPHIHAAGASVGINAKGHVDLGSDEASLKGTMVPFSDVNGLIGAIPVIGDLITGGKGQGVFAVAYKIEGPLSDPHIGVNPVSLLTPGILRTLFFGDGPDDDDTVEKPQNVTN